MLNLLKKVVQPLVSRVFFYKFKYLTVFILIGTSKNKNVKETSPMRESRNEEDIEWFSSPDRTVTNTNKKTGKSTLNGNLYYIFFVINFNILF